MAVMTNKEATALSQNADFQRYIISGVAEIASEVLEEDQTSMEPNEAQRRLSVARNYGNYTNEFMLEVAIQENFNKEVTIDSNGLIVWSGGGDFSGAVNNYIGIVWNFVAGISLNDITP